MRRRFALALIFAFTVAPALAGLNWRGQIGGSLPSRGFPPATSSALSKLPVGSTIVTYGDSIFSLAKVFTTAAARTTADNRAIGELIVARAINPRFRHWDWWDISSTNANRGGVYTAVTGANVDTFRSGATFAYPGDTRAGMQLRRSAALNSGAAVIFDAGGTNTDSPNSAAFKIARAEEDIAAALAAGRRYIISTIRPRCSGDREALNNVLSTTSGSGAVTLVRAGHGLTNTSGTTKQVEFISPGVTVAGITLSGIITDGSGGWTVNVADANTITFTSATLANATVNSGGGSFTWHRNFFTSAGGLTAVGLCHMPSSTVWAEYDLYNAWALSKHNPTLGIYTWDNRAIYRDTARSATTGVYLEVKSTHTNDGVHPNHVGAQEAGADLNTNVLDQIFESGNWAGADPATSNLLANPSLATATGGTVGANCTGTLPSGTSVLNVTGAGDAVSCVASVEAHPSIPGANQISFAISSTGAGSGIATLRFANSAVSAGIASTDWIVYLIQANVTTTASCFVGFEATIGQTSTISNRGMRPSGAISVADPYVLTSSTINWIIETEPLLYEARTNATTRLDMYVRKDQSCSVTIKLPYRKLTKIEDPTVLFPWSP